jgi:biopolymer transport protein ExbD
MKDRRSFLRTMAAGIVALAVVVAPAIADELFGVIIKVDVPAKKITVVEKDTDKEVVLTTTEDTEYVTKKGTSKLDLEKLEKNVTKNIDAGKKGVFAKVTHEKGVASKISAAGKKKADN